MNNKENEGILRRNQEQRLIIVQTLTHSAFVFSTALW